MPGSEEATAHAAARAPRSCPLWPGSGRAVGPPPRARAPAERAAGSWRPSSRRRAQAASGPSWLSLFDRPWPDPRLAPFASFVHGSRLCTSEGAGAVADIVFRCRFPDLFEEGRRIVRVIRDGQKKDELPPRFRREESRSIVLAARLQPCGLHPCGQFDQTHELADRNEGGSRVARLLGLLAQAASLRLDRPELGGQGLGGIDLAGFGRLHELDREVALLVPVKGCRGRSGTLRYVPQRLAGEKRLFDLLAIREAADGASLGHQRVLFSTVTEHLFLHLFPPVP